MALVMTSARFSRRASSAGIREVLDVTRGVRPRAAGQGRCLPGVAGRPRRTWSTRSYSRYPRKVKLPLSSHRRRSCACRSSAICSGWDTLPRASGDSSALLRIFGQSSTAALTSPSTRSVPSISSVRAVVVDKVNLNSDPGLHVRRVIAVAQEVRQAWQCGGIAAGDANVGRDPGEFRQLRGFPVAGDHKQAGA